MKINGLKVLMVKSWKPDSTFTADNGTTMPVPANHKVICTDEDNEVVNITFITPSPLNLKPGQELKEVKVAGSLTKSSFGYNLKATL